MTGLWVILGVIVVALVFGGYRRLTDGRARAVVAAADLDAATLGAGLGSEVTFVQFSSPVCAPCRSTAATITDLTRIHPGAAHIELDVGDHIDLVSRFGITRTPTVLVLDARGTVRTRLVGPARRNEVLAAFEHTRPAA
ncbi:MAG TPA: thioredoxin [Propionibacteriaceae bacterium]|nr:thioredoxin [Propionibacteriaceae bacterium]